MNEQATEASNKDSRGSGGGSASCSQGSYEEQEREQAASIRSCRLNDLAAKGYEPWAIVRRRILQQTAA